MQQQTLHSILTQRHRKHTRHLRILDTNDEMQCMQDVSTPLPYCTNNNSSSSSFHVIHLSLEGERGADLVASLVELGGVEGQAEAESGAGVELGAVSKGGDTAVVDLDL
jgi:hypothetical protein